ncbi:T9SS type A sorting domain-containing protein [Paenimyroides aestuarii]|uniref:T9SS type A sorting domain-containing protein n=1 Tax=Paenimyroides aestuarii TaxID=2968490 RepID=A0ABY5NSX4_9FLAO|nr:T9SS type A sorting domain-containing protein [Paenimyroides aestuarii]UUV21633.1 T9SS type A sorting domain-containing protein [Paenimyroides aestuarii]
MIKKILLIFIYCFFINGLFAQPNLEWYGTASAKTLNGDWHFDDNNGVYYIGAFGENQDLDFKENQEYIFKHPSTGNPTKGYGIIKYDLEGNLLWVKGTPIENPGTSEFFTIEKTKLYLNKIYIVGKFYRNGIAPDFDKGNYKIYPDGNRDLVILEYDLDGKFKNANKMYFFSMGGGFLSISNFIVDNSGAFHIGGSFMGNVNFDIKNRSKVYEISREGSTVFYINYSKNYSILNYFTFETDYAECFTFDIDGDENVYITGSFRGKLDLDPSIGENIVTSDLIAPEIFDTNAFIVKIDRNGKYIWGQKLSFEEPRGLLISTKNYLYIGGNFTGNKNLNIIGSPINYQSNKEVNGDLNTPFIGKYNLDGKVEWIKILKSNNGSAFIREFYYKEGIKYAALRGSGEFALSNGEKINLNDNYSSALISFDETSVKKIHTLQGIYTHMYMNQKSSKLITYGMYSYVDAEIPEYEIFLPAKNPAPMGNAGGISQYVAMFNNAEINEDEIEQPGTGTNPNLRLAIYPNPSNGQFIIEVDGYLFGTTYKIFDEAGRKIFEDKVAQQKNEVLINVAAGVYAISFYRNDEIIKSHKIIVK